MSNINNERIDETVFVNGDPYVNPTIQILQTIYNLEKYDFDKLINGKSYLNQAADLLYGICAGLFINMVVKFFGSKVDKDIIFDKWEVYAFFLSLALLIIILFFDHFIPSKKKQVIKKIKSHFNI